MYATLKGLGDGILEGLWICEEECVCISMAICVGCYDIYRQCGSEFDLSSSAIANTTWDVPASLEADVARGIIPESIGLRQTTAADLIICRRPPRE